MLVAQPPAAQKLLVDPHGCADEPQLLRAHPGAYLHMTAPDEESVQGAVGSVELRHVRKVVADYQDLVQFLHLQLLGRLRDLALLLDDAPQRRLVPLIPVRLLPFGIHPQVLLNVLLDGDPAVVDVDGRAKDVDPFEDAPVLLQNQADQRHGFARFGRSEENARARNQGHHGVRGLFAAVFWRGEKLDLSHFLCFTCQTRSREAGRRVCQRTATQQDAGGVLRAIRAASPGVHRCVPTHCRCFPRNPGGESGGVVLYSTALPASGKRRGNPVPTPGLSVAILRPRQD